MHLLQRKKIDIYANISLFLSYSEVTVATRSGPYPAQMVTAVTRSSPYPDQMVDQHLYLHCHFADTFVQSGEYIKRLILKRQTDRGSARNTKYQALLK